MYGHSPISTSKKNANLKLYCEEHPHEKLTNFCFASLRALCPACIDNHNKHMKNQNTFPEVDTLKNVKLNCAKKVNNAIVALSSEVTRLENQARLNPHDIVEEGSTILKRAKEKVLQIVSRVFDELELEFSKKINDVVLRANNGEEIADKIRNLVAELENLLYGIESPNCIEIVRKICMIDVKSLLDKFRKDVNGVMELRGNVGNSFTEIRVDDSIISKINDDLRRYVSLLHKDDQLNVSSSAALNNSGILGSMKGQLPGGNRASNSNSSWEPPTTANNNTHNNHLSSNGNNNNNNNNQGSKAYTALPEKEEEEDRYGLVQYHKTYQNDIGTRFPVTIGDYYENSCSKKFIHFFQNHENRLHYVDLEKFMHSQKVGIESIELDINFRVPPFHKSIAIPNGDIYLIGGADPNNNNKKHNTTYTFDFGKRTLVPRASLNIARSSFAICYMKGYIYAVGGLTNNSAFTSTCEKYDIAMNRWLPIADLNFDVLAPCIAAFNNKYIYKFGGNSIENRLENHVEKYDPVKNKWYPLQPKIDLPYHLKSSYFKMLNTSAAIQINQYEIYIFGGYLDDNTGSNQTFIFRINNSEDDDKNPYNYTITGVAVKTLTHPEAFWNNNPIVVNRNVFALQNIQTSEQDDVCLDDRRRLLIFNGTEWKNIG
jgi:hypothetical protein